MDAQEFVGRRGKKMTNDIAIRDDMKQVERWENEGGRVTTQQSVGFAEEVHESRQLS